MIALIADNRDALTALCRQYGICRLDVFGSAATGEFDSETSDVDFLVDPGGYERGVAKRFFRFAEALEDLLDYRVDLVTEDSITNPYFRQSVNQSRELVFADRGQPSDCMTPYLPLRNSLGFTAGRTRASFLDDRALQLVEIVGEALRQAELSASGLVREIPELRDVVNARNRITHGDNAGNFSLLRDIAQDDIPPLLATLLRLLAVPAGDVSSPADGS